MTKTRDFFTPNNEYLDMKRKSFKVTRIEGEMVYTDQQPYYIGDGEYMERYFEYGSMLEDKLTKINKDPNKKELIFTCAGGCTVCSDSLFEVDGDYKTYAHILSSDDIIFYNKEDLTADEIARIENFAKRNC